MSHKILVVGSTGTVGQHLITLLTEAGEQVKAATTSPEKYPTTQNVEPILLDLADPETYAAALEGVDRVFLLAPTGYLDPYALLAPFVELATRDQNRKIVFQTAKGVAVSEDIPLRRVELLIEQ